MWGRGGLGSAFMNGCACVLGRENEESLRERERERERERKREWDIHRQIVNRLTGCTYLTCK
jgi:hypothetical protein